MAYFLNYARCLLVSLAAGSAILAAKPAAALELTPCRIDAGSAMDTTRAECGVFEVAENPDDPDGKIIGLHIALVPSLNVEPLADPLVLFAGGPGQSAIDSYITMSGAFELVRRDRQILLVDQRGTGRSNALTCPSIDPSMGTEMDFDVAKRLTQECLEQLDGDPRYYTTSVAVGDMNAVRQALGFEQLNLWGGSYGTRVALHFLKTYPQHTRSVIIDGVVPADMLLGPAIALDAQSSLDQLFDRCDEDAACAGAFGNLRDTFDTLRARLTEAPVTVDITHPRNGSIKQQTLNNETLAGVVRLTSYSPLMRALLPLMIDEASKGRYQMLAAQGALVEDQFEDMLAVGMHNAVVCTEDAPFFADDIDVSALEDTYMGALQFEYLREICAIWPAGVLDDGFKDATVSDLPVLVLSGELDPVTPPAYGARAAETLSRSRHIVAPRQGHIVSGAGCMPKLIDQFVDELDPASLQPECIEKLGYTPVFVSPVGPTP